MRSSGLVLKVSRFPYRDVPVAGLHCRDFYFWPLRNGVDAAMVHPRAQHETSCIYGGGGASTRNTSDDLGYYGINSPLRTHSSHEQRSKAFR